MCQYVLRCTRDSSTHGVPLLGCAARGGGAAGTELAMNECSPDMLSVAFVGRPSRVAVVICTHAVAVESVAHQPMERSGHASGAGLRPGRRRHRLTLQRILKHCLLLCHARPPDLARLRNQFADALAPKTLLWNSAPSASSPCALP